MKSSDDYVNLERRLASAGALAEVVARKNRRDIIMERLVFTALAVVTVLLIAVSFSLTALVAQQRSSEEREKAGQVVRAQAQYIYDNTDYVACLHRQQVRWETAATELVIAGPEWSALPNEPLTPPLMQVLEDLRNIDQTCPPPDRPPVLEE